MSSTRFLKLPTFPFMFFTTLYLPTFISYPFTVFNGNQIDDLATLNASSFVRETYGWTAVNLTTSAKMTTCNNIPMLGGPGILNPQGYFQHTYTSLPSHDIIYFRIQLFIIDDWQSTDTAMIQLDTKSFTIGDISSSKANFQSNFCGKSEFPDLADFAIVGKAYHNTSAVTLKLISKLNQASSMASFGVGRVSLLFALKTANDVEGSCNIANITLASNSCGCPKSTYPDPLNAGKCLACHQYCAECFGPTASQCYACNASIGSSFAGGKCIKCATNCKDCSWTGKNNCIKCFDNAWTRWDYSCPTTCDAPVEDQEIVGNIKLCKPNCDSSYYTLSNGSCATACPSPLSQWGNDLGKFCQLPCADSLYQYFNGSCLSTCPVPLVKSMLGDVAMQCLKPCGSGQYLYPDGTCSKNCSAPFTTGVQNAVDKCIPPCWGTSGFYEATNKTCLSSCDAPNITKQENFYNSCTIVQVAVPSDNQTKTNSSNTTHESANNQTQNTTQTNTTNTTQESSVSQTQNSTQVNGTHTTQANTTNQTQLETQNNTQTNKTNTAQGSNMNQTQNSTQVNETNNTNTTEVDTSSPNKTESNNTNTTQGGTENQTQTQNTAQANQTKNDTQTGNTNATKIQAGHQTENNTQTISVNKTSQITNITQISTEKNPLATFKTEPNAESSIFEAASTTMTVTTTLAVVLGTSNPAIATVGGFLKMFPYLRYMSISYPPKLQLMLDNLNSSFISFNFGFSMPTGAQTQFLKHNLPGKFDYYQLHSSFLVNYWETMTSLIILLACVVFISIATNLLKRRYELHEIFKGLKLMVKWNFFLMVYCSNLDGIILSSSLEFRTFSNGSGLEVLSFLFCIVMVISLVSVLGFGLYIIIDIRKKKRQAYPENYKIQSEAVSPEDRWKEYQMFFKGARSDLFIRHTFLLIYLGRMAMFNVVIAYLFEYPLTQAVLIVLMSVFLLAYMLIVKPFTSKLVLCQHVTDEILMLVINVSVLALAILDNQSTDHSDSRIFLGNMIIYISIIFSITTNIYLVAYLGMGLKDAYTITKTQKKRGIVAFFMALLAPFESGGMTVETETYPISMKMSTAGKSKKLANIQMIEIVGSERTELSLEIEQNGSMNLSCGPEIVDDLLLGECESPSSSPRPFSLCQEKLEEAKPSPRASLRMRAMRRPTRLQNMEGAQSSDNSSSAQVSATRMSKFSIMQTPRSQFAIMPTHRPATSNEH